MNEKAAVVTVEGKAYFLIVNKLREQSIPFLSLVPGKPLPAKVKVVITTPKEQNLVKHEKTLILKAEGDLDCLTDEVKRILLGKEVYEKIVVGIDPGKAVGLAVLADGKLIEEGNCYSTQEVIGKIIKTLKNVNFSQTDVSVKIGNGVPIYKKLLEALDIALPHQVALEVVNEARTNKPLKDGHSREIRHISSAIRIAGRTGHIANRRNQVAANSRIQ
jgi:hypothetical protein